jgi:2,5-diketo-D-gluconate reductase B
MNLGAVLETMMALRAEGRIREIGVSNFPLALLRQAVEEIGAPIVCNQIEYHVLLDQSALLSYARAHGLFVTAYCPLAQGRLAEHPALAAIARKHGATPAQVALKWLLDQEAVAAIPKAGRRESQAANLAAWRISLDDEDRAALRALPKNQRFVSPPFAPAWDPPAVS